MRQLSCSDVQEYKRLSSFLSSDGAGGVTLAAEDPVEPSAQPEGKPPIIRFSHIYEKHGKDLNHGSACAFLLAVQPCRVSELPPEFLEYDTRFYTAAPDGSILEDHYLLDFDDALLLVFYDPRARCVYPTLRRRTPAKERYYRGLLNRKILAVVTGERDAEEAQGGGADAP
jgi:hypothetical protein